MFASSVALPPGNTANTGLLSVCNMLEPMSGGVFGVLAPDAPLPGTLFNVPARIRGLEPEAILDMDGSGECRREAADSEGRSDRGIVLVRRSLSGRSGSGDAGT